MSVATRSGGVKGALVTISNHARIGVKLGRRLGVFYEQVRKFIL